MEATSDRLRTFKEWRTLLLREYSSHEPGERSWFTVGDWLINAKENNSYKAEGVAYHVCEENYKRVFSAELNIKVTKIVAASVSGIEEGCKMCDEPMPDGIKMVALLEKL